MHQGGAPGCQSALLGGGIHCPALLPAPQEAMCMLLVRNRQNTPSCRCLPLATWKASMVTMNAEEGWAKPLHCGLGFFSPIHLGARIVHVCQRELTLLPPAVFYPFLPVSVSTHPQSEDERQVHTHSIYFSPDLGVLVRLLRI